MPVHRGKGMNTANQAQAGDIKRAFLVVGGWLTLLDASCPPKLLCHYPPQLDRREKIKGSLVEIRMRKGSLIDNKTD